MRILLVTMDYPPPMGGIQIVAKNLETDLAAAGHDVRLLNFDGRNTSNFGRLTFSDLTGSRATLGEYFRLSKIANPTKLMDPDGYRGFVYQNLIYRVTKEARQKFRPNITHILNPTLYSAVFDSAEPFVVSCHGSDVQDTYPVRFSLSRAKRIHCVSEYVRGLVAHLAPDGGRRALVIHNSVELSLFAGDGTRHQNTIVTCARLVKRKNVASLIQAMALLPQGLLQSYRLRIVGDGPEMPHLRRLTKRLGLENVEFAGEITSRSEYARQLANGKVFVLCPLLVGSSIRALEGHGEPGEGFGIVYVEAQAAGLPVIASTDGGIPEAVGDGGLLVRDPTDAEEIAQKIRMLLEDENLYYELSQNAKRRVASFSRQAKLVEFENLYAQALGED